MRRFLQTAVLGVAVAGALGMAVPAFAATPLVGVGTQNSVSGSSPAATEYNLQQTLIYGITGLSIPHDYVVATVAGVPLLAVDPVYFFDPEEY